MYTLVERSSCFFIWEFRLGSWARWMDRFGREIWNWWSNERNLRCEFLSWNSLLELSRDSTITFPIKGQHAMCVQSQIIVLSKSVIILIGQRYFYSSCSSWMRLEHAIKYWNIVLKIEFCQKFDNNFHQIREKHSPIAQTTTTATNTLKVSPFTEFHFEKPKIYNPKSKIYHLRPRNIPHWFQTRR